MSVLNKKVSYFPGITATAQGVGVDLLTLLQSNKHKEAILRLRESNEDEQKRLKEKLPCYTVAGFFSRRCEEGLIQLTGLAAVDLDSAQDYDAVHLINELKKIDCIAYAGLSCRGKRLFCIVPFKYPDKYERQYERLKKSFIDMGLPMGDDCHKRISQPRFVSWNGDATQFFNHDAKPYHLVPVEKTYYNFKTTIQSTSPAVPVNAFEWCVNQQNKHYSFCQGARHEYIVHLVRYCNIKGLSKDETLKGCLQFIEADFSEGEIEKIVRHIYTKQADSHAKSPFSQRARSFDSKAVQEQREEEQQLFDPVRPKKSKEKEDLRPVKLRTSATESNPVEREGWDQDTAELENFFASTDLPATPVRLNQYSTVTNIASFIHSHLETVKVNNGKGTFLPYLNRLQELKQVLTKNLN